MRTKRQTVDVDIPMGRYCWRQHGGWCPLMSPGSHGYEHFCNFFGVVLPLRCAGPGEVVTLGYGKDKVTVPVTGFVADRCNLCIVKFGVEDEQTSD